MTLTMRVDTTRWRGHQRRLLAAVPGLVPVVRRNGYGFGNARLATEAGRLGARVLAVGTTGEAVQVLSAGFPGDVLIMDPYRAGEPATQLPPGRVLRTAADFEALRALAAAGFPRRRTVVECGADAHRQGIGQAELHLLADGPPLAGFALHPRTLAAGASPCLQTRTALPASDFGYADHLELLTGGTGHPLTPPHALPEAVGGWIRAIEAAGLRADDVFLGDLRASEAADLMRRHPETAFRCRVGTRLWLGAPGALTARAAVLDTVPVGRGERFGRHRRRAAVPGRLLVVAGGTADGIGLEAVHRSRSLAARCRKIARAGRPTAHCVLSPYSWRGRPLQYAEPPYRHTGLLFVPEDTVPPEVGDELVLTARHATTSFDRVVHCEPAPAPAADPGGAVRSAHGGPSVR